MLVMGFSGEKAMRFKVAYINQFNNMEKLLKEKLLRDIRNYIEQLDESKIGHTDFFSGSEYTDSQNRRKPCFDVTKKGCEFIAHKLTGQKGTEFTARYINRFHDMEEKIATRKLSAIEQLQLQSQAILEVNDKINAVDTKVDNVQQELEDFKQDLPLLGVEIDKITNAVKAKGVKVLGGKESNAYNENSIRTKLYQDIHREVRRQFGVSTYKAIKRNQCEKAVELIEKYEPPIYLKEQIDDTNAQMRIV